MKNSYFIGVDSGSQSTKVHIFNMFGEIVCSESQPLRPLIARKPGYAEHPDDDLWDSLKIVLSRLMKKFDGDINDIKGLGLCTIRCCRVFMKADGTLARPIMSWMDIRAYETFKDSPDIAYTCPSTGYITHRLTGQFKDTVANSYQAQFPIDMNKWEWSEDKEYFESFNIPKEKLFQLEKPGSILGYITKEASNVTGLPEGLPVVATANDKSVEALGSGLIEENVGLFSLGTYCTSMVYGVENKPDTDSYYTNLSSVPYKFLYESGGIRRGMWHVSWYKNILGSSFEEKAKSEGYIVENYLAKEAENITVGSDGLLTIPDWLAPADQKHRKGLMIGFDERHTRGHIYRSILEGLAMTQKNHYDAMIKDLGINPQKIIISGGGSNSDLLMQIFADMYGVKAVRKKVNEAVGLGSAICAAVAVGAYESFEEAVTAMVKPRDEFLPNMQNHKKYEDINNKAYKHLPALTEQALKTIYSVFEEN